MSEPETSAMTTVEARVEDGVGAIKAGHACERRTARTAARRRERRIEVARTAEPVEDGSTQVTQRQGDLLPEPVAAVTNAASGSTGHGPERIGYTDVPIGATCAPSRTGISIAASERPQSALRGHRHGTGVRVFWDTTGAAECRVHGVRHRRQPRIRRRRARVRSKSLRRSRPRRVRSSVAGGDEPHGGV